jgi:hypothetical protein
METELNAAAGEGGQSEGTIFGDSSLCGWPLVGRTLQQSSVIPI